MLTRARFVHTMPEQYLFAERGDLASGRGRLQEALCTCDVRKLLGSLLEEQTGCTVPDDFPGSKAGAALVRKVEATLRLMESLEPEEAGGSRVVVPWEQFEVVSPKGVVRRRVSAALVDVSRLDEAGRLAGECGRCTSVVALDGGVLSRAGGLTANTPWGRGSVDRSINALERESWATSLGYGIWLPGNLEERERYNVLASVFWAMTRLGFDCAAQSLRYGERLSPKPPAGTPGSPDELPDCTDCHLGSSTCENPTPCKAAAVKRLLNYNSWLDFLETISHLRAA